MNKARLIVTLASASLLLTSCSFFHDLWYGKSTESTESTLDSTSSTSTSSTSSTSEPSTTSIPVEIVSLSLSGTPFKTTYYVGESFDSNGLIVKAHYSDSTTQTVLNSLCEWVDGTTLGSTLSLGTTSVKCRYKSKETTYSGISVIPNAETLSKTNISCTYEDYNDNNWYSGSIAPSIGNVKLLVIPIWFSDSSTYIKNSYKSGVLNDIKTAYIGTTSQTGWHSVKTFYEAESHGKLTLNATVSSWYDCGESSTSFYSDYGGTSATVNLVTTATDWYFSVNPSDARSNYDYDKDGYLDGVMLIYASPDTRYLSSGDDGGNMWAYCYWAPNYPNISSPEPCAFFWASYNFMYGSSSASSKTGTSYYGGDTSHCLIDTHTFIHEMGHVFGLDDYYDYSNQYNPAGGFSMQDYNVGSHDPYSVMALGWADPYIPSESTTITLNPFQSSGDLILLTPEWNNYDSPFDEYLLLELYTPTGLNEFDATYSYEGRSKGPSNAGIRLWHVDARLLYGDSDNFSAANVTTNPNTSQGRVYHMMSNTYDEPNYGSPLGSSYYNYNILQLIRNNTFTTYQPTDTLSNASLFGNGSSFNTSTYKNQFVKSDGCLNSGATLGWSFSVAIIGSGASAKANITLTKA